MSTIKTAWVLRAKDYKEDGMPVYLSEEEPTTDLQEAFVIYDKQEFLDQAVSHEELMKEKYGENAICNAGYTNITKWYEFVEVDVEVFNNE